VTVARAGRDLSALFAPASVAIVGASDDRAKWGHWMARGALRGAGRRTVMLVNRRGGTVLGEPAHPSLGALPEPPELTVVCVPPAALDATVDEAIAAGTRAIVVITAGMADGDAGGARDRALAARARAAGVVLLGPNCMGVYDAGEQLDLASDEFPAGPIGLISQSGNLALEVAMRAADAGLGFSRFASVGNQADVGIAELVHAFAAHDATEVIAVYAEDVRDGRAFAAAAEAARKPVVLLAVAHGEATARAVASHTGALASDGAAIDAACAAAGIERVRTPGELVDVADGLLRAGPLAGRRVAVLADGGGHGGIAAGLLEEAGLALPRLGDDLQAALRAGLPPTAAVSNPIDLAGGGEQDVRSFDRTAALLLRSGEVDAVVVTGYFGGYAGYGEPVAAGELAAAAGLAGAARETGRPVLVQSMHPATPPSTALREGGIPVFPTIERAVAVTARLAARGATAPAGVPALPPPAPPVGPDAGRPVPADAGGYTLARSLLAAAGVPFVAMETAESPDAAVAAAGEVGYPVAVKALGLLHKSDAGGVALGLADARAVAEAVADMARRLAPAGFSVERMAPTADGVELLIGARWDARFGPVALAGLGGLHTEILRDAAVALAPVTEEHARALILSLRAASLLTGARGRPPLDVDAAAAALAALSRAAAEHPELAALEVNPLLVLPDGALGLDARLELA
jgi:acyl-CoA synthetase (NDP forming)